jgi:hypothetical protein
MATTLPIPIEFRMPDDWQPAAPDEAGAPGAAFIALIPDRAGGSGVGGSGGFTANVTIDGEVPPASATLTSLADRSVEILRELGTGVTVLDRTEVGSPTAPALTQTVRLTTPGTGGADRELVAAQVYLSMHDTHDPTKRAVIRLALTATAAQARAIMPDFQWFVSTVRPENPRSDPH